MNIIDLKNVLFTELKEPLGFLKHKNLSSTGAPTEAKQFGGTTYFYNNGTEWREEMPECRVMIGEVNKFTKEQHQLELSCPQKWSKSMVEKLKNAAQIAFESGQVLIPDGCEGFEGFWEHCNVPKLIRVETYAYTRRGRRQLFVPIFFGKTELTGTQHLNVGDVVQATIRWHLCQTKDDNRLYTGFRPMFSGGIRLVRRDGLPPPIRSPWSWNSVDFTTLSVPMFNSLCVKVPCMTILSQSGNTLQVQPPHDFESALNDFHEMAGVDTWDHAITIRSAAPARAGARLLATIVPTINNKRVEWMAVKHRILPNRPNTTAVKVVAEAVVEAEAKNEGGAGKAAVKRGADSMDMSCTAKTKRQCSSSDKNVHKTK